MRIKAMSKQPFKDEDFKSQVLTAITLVLEQNKASIEGTDCVYKSSDGLRCVVGHMPVVKKNYNEEMEFKSCVGVFGQFEGLPYLSGEQEEILLTLQAMHDGAVNSSESFRYEFLNYECTDDLDKKCELPEDITEHISNEVARLENRGS